MALISEYLAADLSAVASADALGRINIGNWSKRRLWVPKTLVKKILGSNKIWIEKKIGPTNNFGSKEFLVESKLRSKKF